MLAQKSFVWIEFHIITGIILSSFLNNWYEYEYKRDDWLLNLNSTMQFFTIQLGVFMFIRSFIKILF